MRTCDGLEEWFIRGGAGEGEYEIKIGRSTIELGLS